MREIPETTEQEEAKPEAELEPILVSRLGCLIPEP